MLWWDMRHLFSLLSFALLACLVSGDSFAGEARAEASPKAAHQLRIATLAPRQSFHLRQSTDLTNFQPLSPPIDITVTTAQPLAITVDRTTNPKLFYAVFAGSSPAP